MARYSSRCGLGLGIVQIMVGLWFLVMVGVLVKYMKWPNWPIDNEELESLILKYTPEWISWPDAISRGTILTFTFISSGSLAIAAAKKKTKFFVIVTFGFSILSSITAFILVALSIGELVEYEHIESSGIVGLPALIMFIVSTISAINCGIRVCSRRQPAQVINGNSPSMGEKNMGTRCENVAMDSAAENNPTTEELSLGSSLKKYFCLGVFISDPVLNFVKWIAFITEIGTAVGVPLLLFLRSFVTSLNAHYEPYEEMMYLDLVLHANVSTICGLIAFSYVHIMWVKPSRHLLRGLQQLSARKFVPWMLTTFIHSLPVAYFCFTVRVMLEKYRREFKDYDYEEILAEEFLPEVCFERRLRPDLSYWVVGCLVILAPQVVVLLAVIRVARLRKEGENVSPAIASSQPDPSRPQYVNLTESSPSQNGLNDLPPY